jgi:hypothetical protein
MGDNAGSCPVSAAYGSCLVLPLLRSAEFEVSGNRVYAVGSDNAIGVDVLSLSQQTKTSTATGKMVFAMTTPQSFQKYLRKGIAEHLQ